MDRISSGELPADLAFVLSNNSKCGALAKAKAFGIPAHHVSAVTEGGDGKAASRLAEIVRESAIDLLVLAGYMKLVPASLHALLPNRILNIHPALLPAFGGAGFYGAKVHEAVIARGCQFTGITIHMVNGDYDEGQIILQSVVPVAPGSTAESLAAEVLKLEHSHYWRVVRAFAVGELKPVSGSVPGRAVDMGGFLDRYASSDLI